MIKFSEFINLMLIEKSTALAATSCSLNIEKLKTSTLWLTPASMTKPSTGKCAPLSNAVDINIWEQRPVVSVYSLTDAPNQLGSAQG